MKNENRLRVGIVGCGYQGANMARACVRSQNWQITACADPHIEAAEKLACELHIPGVHASLEALLANSDVDAVIVAAPHHLLCPLTLTAIHAGKHVLCEKPLATTLADVDTMIAAAKANNVVVTEAFMYRHHPQTLKVKEIIDSGRIGEVRLVRGSFTFTLRDRGNVRVNAGLDGGSVWDVGCYPISYARTMIGAEPAEVQGMQVIGESGVDETFVGTMHFSNGAYAQFDSGFHAPFRMNMEIVGSEGLIVIPRAFKPTDKETIYIGTASDQLEPVEVTGPEHLYMGEVDDLYDAIVHGRAPRVSLDDSRKNVAAILALLQSAREGRPVKL